MDRSEMSGPQPKKAKFMEPSIIKIDSCIKKINMKKSLQAVLSDDISNPISLITVLIGHLKNVKDISKTVLLLNEKMPIKELQHLKRVKQGDIVICPISYLKDVSGEEFVNQLDDHFKNLFDNFKVIDVPLTPPKLKSQYEASKKYWPCNFHPDKYLEKLVSNEFFTTTEIKLHRRYMELTLAIAKWFIGKSDVIGNCNSTVIVDPNINSVVAISFDNRELNPIQHSAMLAIDNVAKTQKGGAWSTNDKLDSDTMIDLKLLEFLKQSFVDIKFGHRMFKSKSITEFDETIPADGPYLCTGYNIYMLKEPCIMCGMALVHARVKRVFFCLENETDGALMSKAKLQTMSSLNHRFEVFTGFL